MKIICIARNYAAHAEELDRQVGGGTPCPPEPAWFLKPDTALLRNNDPFYIPAFSQEVHYECELVVRINRVGKGIAERFAHRDYDQVGLGIDFTARDLQRQAIAEGRIEIPVARQGAVYDEPAAMVNEHYNPFAEGYVAEGADEQCGDVEEFPGEDFTEFPGPTPRGGRPAAGGDVGASRRGAAPHPAFDPVGEYLLSDREGGYDEVPSSAVAPDDAAVPFAGMADVPSSLGGGAVVAEDDAQRSVLEYVSSEDAAVQQRLIETPAAEFRGVTPVAPGYVVAMLGGVLVVVDLKRAQERLLYEYYLLMLTNGSAVSEQLLFPERLVLSHDEYELLGQYAAEFAAVGFDIERVGDGAIDVKGTPADMPSDTIDELIYQLLQTFAHVSAADLRRQRIAAELARSGARPMGSCTSQEEAERLLERLQEAGDRCFSPAGKPILAEITLDELRAKLR